MCQKIREEFRERPLLPPPPQVEPLHLTEEGALPGVTQEDGASVLPGLMPFSAGHLAFLGLPRSAPWPGDRGV